MTPLQTAQALAPCPPALTAQLNALLAIAEAQTSTAYGDHRNTAVALLALHWMTLNERKGGSAGAVVSETVGDLSRTYAQTQAQGTSGQDLGSTRWGQQLLALRRSTILGVRNRRLQCPA